MDRPRLDAGALAASLALPWTLVDVVAETESTNADLLADPPAHGTVLVAEFQSGGRGRLERHWVSPARAGLTFSVALRPSAPMPTWTWLPLLAGVAVCDGIRRRTFLPAKIKWPNDVLIEGRKVAGLLVEAADGGVVIGVGLNVTTTAEELAALPEATSLVLEGAEDLDRRALLSEILTEIGSWYTKWAAADGDAEASGLRRAYVQRCGTLSSDVTVTPPTGTDLVGRAVDVDGDGRLVVEAGGVRTSVSAGDVHHVR